MQTIPRNKRHKTTKLANQTLSMVKNGITVPWDLKTREHVLKLRAEGHSRKEIREMTGVNRQNQYEWEKRQKEGRCLMPAIPRRTGVHNGNSKITETYIQIAKTTVKEKPNWDNKEQLWKLLEQKTGVRITLSYFYSFCKTQKLHITIKKRRVSAKNDGGKHVYKTRSGRVSRPVQN